MNTPKEIIVQRHRERLIKTKKNIYGQGQSGRVSNKLLAGKQTSSLVGFRKCKVEECVFYNRKSIYLLYTDNYIMEGTDKE